jgi:plastocyanin
MYISRRAVGSIATVLCCTFSLAACISHAVNDDGADITNPLGHNPGTHTLLLSAPTNDLGVGEGTVITATYDGVAVTDGVPGNSVVVTSSNTSVIGSALGVHAFSVGSATITATYQGSTATIGFSVHQLNGLSAILAPFSNAQTGTAAWTPPTVTVSPGSTVEFILISGPVSHNVVFDAVLGAPNGIPQSGSLSSATRAFPTSGIYTYSCTLHGETGVITILQQ